MALVTGPTVARRPLLLLVGLALVGAAACTEDLATEASCADPRLCPEQSLQVEQVELEPVVEDTALSGFPLRGTESRLLAARSGDSLDVRAVFRFDSLPSFYRTAGGDSLPVTSPIEPVVEVLVGRRGDSYVPQATTLEAFDVDVAGDDTSTAELAAAFTPARRLGAATVPVRAATDTTSVDTLRIPLDPATLVAHIVGSGRLRVGLRVVDAQDARLSLSPTAARVVFRAVADTAVRPLAVTPISDTPVGQSQLQVDFSSFTVVVAGTSPAAGPVLTVGGLPGSRALLRFAIPTDILNETTILRATLVLTQRPVGGFLESDTLLLQPLAVTTSAAVTDLRRRILFAANPPSPFTGRAVLSANPLLVAPGRVGTVELPIPELVGAWRTVGEVGLRPELVLASGREGASPVHAQFYSREAAAGLRPVLRVSFVRSIDFDLP